MCVGVGGLRVWDSSIRTAKPEESWTNKDETVGPFVFELHLRPLSEILGIRGGMRVITSGVLLRQNNLQLK